MSRKFHQNTIHTSKYRNAASRTQDKKWELKHCKCFRGKLKTDEHVSTCDLAENHPLVNYVRRWAIMMFISGAVTFVSNLKSSSIQNVNSPGYLSFAVQNFISAEFDTIRLFSHSSAQLEPEFKTYTYGQDFVTSQLVLKQNMVQYATRVWMFQRCKRCLACCS